MRKAAPCLWRCLPTLSGHKAKHSWLGRPQSTIYKRGHRNTLSLKVWESLGAEDEAETARPGSLTPSRWYTLGYDTYTLTGQRSHEISLEALT